MGPVLRNLPPGHTELQFSLVLCYPGVDSAPYRLVNPLFVLELVNEMIETSSEPFIDIIEQLLIKLCGLVLLEKSFTRPHRTPVFLVSHHSNPLEEPSTNPFPHGDKDS